MIIVFDLMSDAKIQLISHQHEIHALAFSPVGAGNSPNGGDYLISIDYNRNESPETESQSVMCLWNWQSGQCLQEINIPQSRNDAFLLASTPHNSSSFESRLQRYFKIVFDKTGQMFMVVESSPADVGGGYRASMWSFSRT
jgi:hypothetical protein